MAGNNSTMEIQLHQVQPSEQVGRDTIARYQAQYRAAAMECLKLLDVGSIDRVYSEFHDDFVSRRSDAGSHFYSFFQVKTAEKRNRQWSILELFGVPKPKKKKPTKKAGAAKVKSEPESDDIAIDVDEALAAEIAKSFVGKLLLHSVRFHDACEKVSFLTNVNLNDDAESVVAALLKGFSEPNDVLETVAKHFNSAYKIAQPLTPDEVKRHLLKLCFDPGLTLLNPGRGDYETLASKAIYKFSEIDLTHSESAQISANLVSLVERKSFPKMKFVPDAAALADRAGIGLSDLLDLLSISDCGYQELLVGGDESALKSASIIQRKLKMAGASQLVIDGACKWKVEWDNWYRTYRHLDEADMDFILHDIAAVRERWARGEVSFHKLRDEASAIMKKWDGSYLGHLLSKQLIVGGVLAELVRSESQAGRVG